MWQIKGKEPTILFGFILKEINDRTEEELEGQMSPKQQSSAGFWSRCFEFEANLLKPRLRWRSWSRGYRMLSLRFSLVDGSHCWLRPALGAWLQVWRSSTAWLSFSIQSSFSCLVSAENQHLSDNIVSRLIGTERPSRISPTAEITMHFVNKSEKLRSKVFLCNYTGTKSNVVIKEKINKSSKTSEIKTMIIKTCWEKPLDSHLLFQIYIAVTLLSSDCVTESTILRAFITCIPVTTRIHVVT